MKFGNVRKDLFRFIDIVALKGDQTYGIQVTTTSHMPAREQKIMSLPEYYRWKEAGNKVVIHGWAKRGGRDKRKLWTLKEKEV